MLEPNIVDSNPKPEDLRVIHIGEVPSLSSSYAKVAAGVIRPKKSRTVSLPGTRWETTAVIPRQLVDEYNTLLGASGVVGHNSAPSLTAHITAFGLSTAMMAESRFPIPLLGMVHLQHKVWHMSDVPIDQPVKIATWGQNLAPHHAGTTVEIWAQIFDPSTDKLLWQSMALYLSKSVTLPGTDKPPRPERQAFQPPPLTGEWQLPKDIGRRYGAVSGDRNPIHLSNLTAKALGMPGAIAHGMYAAGKMLAGRETTARYTWAIEFASPMRLPSKVAINYRQEGDKQLVTGWNARQEKLHFLAEIRLH
ncbi:MaoC/PaaZ C-terminal domain-containing protein [Yaniella flava]|uniref:MaoC/PaaZ C-terminal domain-containing protein n=1 Tax=Yaniella flava TaxID=287930 RepID=A0ABP5G4L1_9MICC